MADKTHTLTSLERHRARVAALKARSQAAELKTELAESVSVAEAEREAEEAKQRAITPEAQIRRQRGTIERQAEAAKAAARKAQRIEARKKDLPISKPQDIGAEAFIADVEKARKEAHRKGKSAVATIKHKEQEYRADIEKKLATIAPYKVEGGYDLAKMIGEGYTVGQLKELGFDADVVGEVDQYLSAIKKIESYKVEGGYDLARLIQDGYTIEQLRDLGFNADAIGEASKHLVAVKEIEPYKVEGGYDLAKMLEAGYTTTQLIDLGFDAGAVDKVSQHLDTIKEIEPYKVEDGYDLAKMLEAGYTTAQLKDMGFDADAVGEVDKYLVTIKEIEPYKTEDGYDLAKMLEAGYTAEQLKDLGFDAGAVDEVGKQLTAIKEIEPYKTEDGYDLVKMMQAGYTATQLKDLGFDASAVDEVGKYLVTVKEIEPYKTEDGYDLTRMLEAGYTTTQLKDMGFDASAVDEVDQYLTTMKEIEKYKTEDGYDLMKMMQAGYTSRQLKDLGFDPDAVRETQKYLIAIEQVEPYKNPDGTYDTVAISKAIDKNHLDPTLVTLLFGEVTVPQYLTVAQVNQLRFAASYAQAKMMADAWGISYEQLDLILAAPTAVAAQVYAYLQETYPESLVLTHESKIASIAEKQQQTISWTEFSKALNVLKPYEIKEAIGERDTVATHKTYDVVAAYKALMGGKITEKAFRVVLGKAALVTMKSFVAQNIEIKPDQWVLKTDWEALTPSQQKEVIGTGQYTIALEQTFNDMVESGEIAKDAVYEGEAPDGGFMYSSPSAVTVEVETAKGKVTMPLAEWEAKTAIEQFEIVLGRKPTKVEWEGYRLLEAGLTLPWWKELIPGVSDIVGTIALLIPGEITEERYVTVKRAAGVEWQKAYPELKWSGAAISGVEKLGFLAAKAMYPQVSVKDVTGHEWAMTGLNIALWSLPAWLPKVVRGIKVLMPSKVTARLRTVPFSETPGLQRIPVLKKTVVLTKTIAAKEVGMTKVAYKRFLQARVRTPGLTPQIFKVLESVGGKLKVVVRKPSGLPKYTYPRRVGVGEITKADWLKLWKPSQVQPTFTPRGWVVTASGKYMPVGKTPISLPDVPISLVIRAPIITGTGRIISPVTVDHVVKSLGLKTAQVAGKQPLSTVQVTVLAQVLGISGTKVVTMAKQGKLSQAVQQHLNTLRKKLVELSPAQATALTKTLAKLQTKALTQGQTQTLAKALNLNETQTRALLQNMTKLQPVAQQAVRTPTKVKTKVPVKVTTKVPVKVTTKVITKKRLIKPPPKGKPKRKEKEERKQYPAGTIAFKMGELKSGGEWKVIPPPYTLKKPISDKYPPVGVRVTEGTPQQTLTFIKGKVPFKDISFDLGVVDGFINVKRRVIRFGGSGEKTDVGQRIPSPTTGLSFRHVPQQERYRIKRRRVRNHPKLRRKSVPTTSRAKW